MKLLTLIAMAGLLGMGALSTFWAIGGALHDLYTTRKLPKKEECLKFLGANIMVVCTGAVALWMFMWLLRH